MHWSERSRRCFSSSCSARRVPAGRSQPPLRVHCLQRQMVTARWTCALLRVLLPRLHEDASTATIAAILLAATKTAVKRAGDAAAEAAAVAAAAVMINDDEGERSDLAESGDSTFRARISPPQDQTLKLATIVSPHENFQQNCEL